MRHSRKAATLIELLIYSVLLLLLVGAILASFQIARNYYTAVQIETEAQQAALKANLSVTQELAHAAGSSITVSTTPPAVLFLSAKTDQGPFQHDETTGELLWQRWVCIYLDKASQELKYAEQLLAEPVTEIPDPPPAVATLVNDTALAKRVLAHDVSDFVPNVTTSSTVSVEVTSSLAANRMPSGQSTVKGQDTTTQIILKTEVPIRQ